MEDSGLLIAGLCAAFLGFTNIESARRRRFFRPLALFWAVVAGYWFWKEGARLWGFGGTDALAASALAFCTASPVLGWLWWGKNGLIRKRIGRFLMVVTVALAGLVLWSALLGAGPLALSLAVLGAALPFVPFRKHLRRWRSARSARQYRRAQRQQVRVEESRKKQEQRDWEQAEAERNRLSADLAAHQAEIQHLQAGTEHRQVQRTQQREEIEDQIRLLRTAEVERIRQDGAGLHFHPHFGFLMAEAWRVLRAQVARGERIPAAEHDAFFFQVIEELLKPENFFERYFHREGQQAIASVNRYLAGEHPLSTALEVVRQLQLQPHQLAPEPLPDAQGVAMVEAWLVPHRRFQDQQREDFQVGRHPQQTQVIEFLRRRKLPLPDQWGWRGLWDEHPAVFVSRQHFAGSVHRTTDRGLWQTVSSIWRSAKAK